MRARFIAIVVFQILLLSGMVAYREYWVSTGVKILLKTTQVDPRDVFRGDYARLNYEITDIDLDTVSSPGGFLWNDTVYVGLEKGPDGTFGAISAEKSAPPQGIFIKGRVRNEIPFSRWEITVKDDSGDEKMITASWFSQRKPGERMRYCVDAGGRMIFENFESDAYKPDCVRGSVITGSIKETVEKKTRRISIEYGIESYFVEEGRSMEIERGGRGGRGTGELRIEAALLKDGKATISRLFIDGKPFK